MRYRSALPLALSAFATANAAGQEVFATTFGKDKQALGRSVAAGPDLDGDGFSEVAIGAPSYAATGEKGKVRIRSGRDLSHVIVLSGALDEEFGFSVCWCGDLDGDGVSELAVGVPYAARYAGEIRIYSPATWTVFRTLTASGSGLLGYSLTNAGDLDGDGIDDLLAGAPTLTSGGQAFLFSGSDGSTLLSFARTGTYKMGASVAAIGDTNGDGVVDLAIGSPQTSLTPYNDQAGVLDLFSGADGSLLWTQVGQWYYWIDGYGVYHYYGDSFGEAVDRAGDVDGDGITDVVVTTVYTNYSAILSGKDGSILRMLYASTDGCMAAIGDLTGDGLPEIAVSGHYYEYLTIFSSLDGKTLWRSGAWPYSPRSIAPIADVDQDGRPDLLLGFPEDRSIGSYNGRVDLRTTNDLWLDLTEHHRDIPFVEMHANEGPTGNLAALVLTGLNGSPAFQVLNVTTFDATKSADLFSGVIPAGFAGTVLDLRAFAIDAGGRLIQSADETLIL